MKVWTELGYVDRELLQVREEIEETENARVTATLWFQDGKLVRRDVHVNVLNGFQIGIANGE